MSALEPYRGADVALPSAIPDAARAIVEWAHSADAAYTLAQKLVTTSFCPAQFRDKPAEAAAAMLAGAEVGLSPMTSMRAFDVIQGTAAPKALTIRAICQSQGHSMVVEESTAQVCRMRGRRRGESEWQAVEWTIQRASQLGLVGKEQWKRQPATMLVARATTELGRLLAADSLLGIGYSSEELVDAEPELTTSVARVGEAGAPRRVARKSRPLAPVPEPEEPSFDEPPASPAATGQDVIEATPEPDEEPAAQTDGGASLKAVQRLAIAMERALGITDRTERLDWISARLDREVVSSKDLSASEVHRLIEEAERGPVEVEQSTEDPWGAS